MHLILFKDCQNQKESTSMHNGKEVTFAMGIAEFTNKLEHIGVEKKECVIVPGFYSKSLIENPPVENWLKKSCFGLYRL